LTKSAFLFASVVTLIGASACGDLHTGALTADQEKQFASENILRRADDLEFRYTADPRGRSERWENRKASIIVTGSRVLIHKNAKVGLEITPAARRDLSVERSADRIRVHSGRGASEEVWSFVPPNDAPGWTKDIRAVINATKSTTRR
jgi:hypothetical protein